MLPGRLQLPISLGEQIVNAYLSLYLGGKDPSM